MRLAGPAEYASGSTQEIGFGSRPDSKPAKHGTKYSGSIPATRKTHPDFKIQFVETHVESP